LSLIDALMEPDCHLLMSNGVEGTHFEKDADGAIEIIDQTLWEQQIQPLCGIDPDQRRHPAVPLHRRDGEPCQRADLRERRVRRHQHVLSADTHQLRHLVGNDPPGRERRLQPVHGRTDRHGRLRGRRRPAAQRRHGRRDRRVHRLLRVHSLTPTPSPTWTPAPPCFSTTKGPLMIQRRTLLKSLPLAAAGMAGAGALASCGSSGGGGGSAGEGGTLTWMSMLHTPTTPEASGPIMTALKEHSGVDFEFQWVPDASKEEKINAALASGSLADINTLNQGMAGVREPLKSGMFWDVEPFLSEFPNLASINPTIIESARLDGVLYGVPFQKPLARYGVLVRQDWLDRLGLEVPHTLEDLLEVAQAFVDGDPTGTGAQVTGFIDRQESFAVGFRSLAGYFGAGDKFQLDDSGKIVPACTTEPWKEAMEWYRGAFERGLVNQEFVTVQKENQ